MFISLILVISTGIMLLTGGSRITLVNKEAEKVFKKEIDNKDNLNDILSLIKNFHEETKDFFEAVEKYEKVIESEFKNKALDTEILKVNIDNYLIVKKKIYHSYTLTAIDIRNEINEDEWEKVYSAMRISLDGQRDEWRKMVDKVEKSNEKFIDLTRSYFEEDELKSFDSTIASFKEREMAFYMEMEELNYGELERLKKKNVLEEDYKKEFDKILKNWNTYFEYNIEVHQYLSSNLNDEEWGSMMKKIEMF